MNAQLAFQILQLVNQHQGEGSEKAMIRARAYREFIETRSTSEEAAPPVVRNPADPGTTRRKAPVGYEVIEKAVYEVLDKKGTAPIIMALAHCGVRQAKELLPTQYDEFLEQLKLATVDVPSTAEKLL